MVKRTSRGTSLVEAMIAMMILAAMGTAIITVTLQVVALNASARLKNQGTAYAEQTLEVVRSNFQNPAKGYVWLSGSAAKSYTDGSLVTVYSPPATTCAPADCAGATIPWTDIGSSAYNRCVVINTPNVNRQIKVQSFIAWPDGGKCRYTEADTFFTNY